MKQLIVIALALTLYGCTDNSRAFSVLTKAGYTQIQLNGYAPFACSEDDVYQTAFTAKGPTGVPVSGAVCCGLIKNCTVRLD